MLKLVSNQTLVAVEDELIDYYGKYYCHGWLKTKTLFLSAYLSI
jgi:hypothetical protein